MEIWPRKRTQNIIEYKGLSGAKWVTRHSWKSCFDAYNLPIFLDYIGSKSLNTEFQLK